MGLVLIFAVLLPAVASAAEKRIRGKGASAESSKKKSAARAKKKADSKHDADPGPADYHSKNFLIHTDLPADEAWDLLKRLETELSLISRYWGRANKQTIECYVVKDLQNWSPRAFDPIGLLSVEREAGVTITNGRSNGKEFFAKATVYATSKRDTPMHEIVHAYCAQTFGTPGPVWYAEGMAEMGHFWQEDDNRSVNCDPYYIKYLRDSEPRPMLEIAKADQVSGDSWQNYAWRWALCHLLANNTNYNDRFRPLGLGLLTQQRVSFEEVYGPKADEIAFEYLFFLQHLDRGYRVDLCSWDWKTKFVHPSGSAILNSKINSAGGWQASKLRVTEGEEYEYSAEGTWKSADDREATSADGAPDGRSRLVGTLFDNYKLQDSIELGSFGTFTAKHDGNLVLRCRDAWHELADNTGFVKVKLKVKGVGKALEPPAPAIVAKPSEADTNSDQAVK
nr:hypothetical protein [uncultured bacterium]